MVRRFYLCLLVMSAIFIAVPLGIRHFNKKTPVEDDSAFITYLNSYGLLMDSNTTADADFARAIQVADKYTSTDFYMNGFKAAMEPNKPFSKARIDLTKVMPASDIAAITDALRKGAQKSSLSEKVPPDLVLTEFRLCDSVARHYADANDPQNAMLIGRIMMAMAVQMKKVSNDNQLGLEIYWMLDSAKRVEKNASAYPEELARIRPLRELVQDRYNKLVAAYRRSPEAMIQRMSKTFRRFMP